MDADTIILIESKNSGVHWAQPGDFDVRKLRPGATLKSFCSNFGEGFHVVFADGEVWYLPSETTVDDLLPFLTIQDAKRFEREKQLEAISVSPSVREHWPLRAKN